MEIFAIFFGAQRTKVPNNRRNRCWVHDWGNVLEVSPHYRHKLHLRLELGDPRQLRIQYERAIYHLMSLQLFLSCAPHSNDKVI
jgi:hypothetical protein